jgi:hypothetical protein
MYESRRSDLDRRGPMLTRGHFKFAARQLIWGRKTMGNTKLNKRISARRAATFLAVIGALVMSSGVALMASATSANAAGGEKWFVCKYVDKPGGGTELLQGGGNPLSVSPSALVGTPSAGAWIPFKDGHSLSYVIEEDIGQAEPDIGRCPLVPPPVDEDTPTTASVVFTDPDCDNGNVASYVTSGTGVDFDAPVAAPGADITVHATAQTGYELQGQAEFQHLFPAEEANCDATVVVEPPVVNPPKHKTKTKTPTVTPTVVHAGLAGATVEDMRGEQGLALMFAGMLMLVAAGGLRLRGSARI